MSLKEPITSGRLASSIRSLPPVKNCPGVMREPGMYHAIVQTEEGLEVTVGELPAEHIPCGNTIPVIQSQCDSCSERAAIYSGSKAIPS